MYCRHQKLNFRFESYRSHASLNHTFATFSQGYWEEEILQAILFQFSSFENDANAIANFNIRISVLSSFSPVNPKNCSSSKLSPRLAPIKALMVQREFYQVLIKQNIPVETETAITPNFTSNNTLLIFSTIR